MSSPSSATETDVIASIDGARQEYEGRIDAARSLATTVLPAGARVVALYPGFEEALAGDGREVVQLLVRELGRRTYASIEVRELPHHRAARESGKHTASSISTFPRSLSSGSLRTTNSRAYLAETRRR